MPLLKSRKVGGSCWSPPPLFVLKFPWSLSDCPVARFLGAGLEAVADAGFGQEVAGVSGFGFELSAELGHVDAEVVGFLPVGGPPYFGQELLLGDEFLGIAHQKFKKAPFGGCHTCAATSLSGSSALL